MYRTRSWYKEDRPKALVQLQSKTSSRPNRSLQDKRVESLIRNAIHECSRFLEFRSANLYSLSIKGLKKFNVRG